MKRWVFWSFTSIVAFLFGCAIVVGLRSAWLSDVKISGRESMSAEKVETQIETTITSFDPYHDLEVFGDMSPESDTFSCRLLETGSPYHAADITAKNGEKWFGLFKNKGTFSLRSATIKVKRIPDELLHGPSSDKKGKLTGKSVSVKNDVEPLFLVKNSPRLRPGSVVTLFEGEKENWKDESVKPTFLDKNFQATYELAGEVYELKVIKAKNQRGEPILALVLEGDGKRQLIHTFWTGTGDSEEKNWFGSVGTLYWVGDLDRDNKPDFYLSLYAHEIIYEAYLLLSSSAERDKLVKKVALFSTSGCC